MTNERDTHEDLPADLARMLGDVAAVDPAVREAHISAALGAINVPGENVVRVEFRRRALISVAAAGLLVLAAGTGWAVRGTGTTSVVAPAGTDMASNEAIEATTDSTGPDAVTKGATDAGSPAAGTFTTVPPCADKVDPGSVYLGEYAGTDGNPTYLIFRRKQTIVFVDKQTCAQVWLSAVTTAP